MNNRTVRSIIVIMLILFFYSCIIVFDNEKEENPNDNHLENSDIVVSLEDNGSKIIKEDDLQDSNTNDPDVSVNINGYWSDQMTMSDYKTSFNFITEENIPNVVRLRIEKTDESGEYYDIRLDIADNIGEIERFHEGWDRFVIGRFHVRDNSITMVESCAIRDLFNNRELIVCLEDDISDDVDESKEGLHYSVMFKEDECILKIYNNRVETGYYETQIWKKGKGLVYYSSGWGAHKSHIEFIQDGYIASL